jgi:hypothetical protein
MVKCMSNLHLFTLPIINCDFIHIFTRAEYCMDDEISHLPDICTHNALINI